MIARGGMRRRTHEVSRKHRGGKPQKRVQGPPRSRQNPSDANSREAPVPEAFHLGMVFGTPPFARKRAAFTARGPLDFECGPKRALGCGPGGPFRAEFHAILTFQIKPCGIQFRPAVPLLREGILE
jgi:hypothetical protein